jgi:hypothetical protein
LIELWSNHSGLDIVLDLCFSREAAQGRREGLLDVLDIQVGVEGNSHASDFQVSHHAVAVVAIVVEWEFELEGIFITARRQRITRIASLLLLHVWSGEQRVDFVKQLPACQHDGAVRSSRERHSLTLCHSNSVLLFSERSLLYAILGPERRVRLSPSSLTVMADTVASATRCTITFPVRKSRFVKCTCGLSNCILNDMILYSELMGGGLKEFWAFGTLQSAVPRGKGGDDVGEQERW